MALVENLVGLNGNKVVNQFVVKVGGKTYFQSYDSIIACIDENGCVSVSGHWDYSMTTRKYFYKFLQDYSRLSAYCKKDILKLIEDGVIKTNLSWKQAI